MKHGVTTPVEAKIDPNGRYAKCRVLALEELDLIISDAGLDEMFL